MNLNFAIFAPDGPVENAPKIDSAVFPKMFSTRSIIHNWFFAYFCIINGAIHWNVCYCAGQCTFPAVAAMANICPVQTLLGIGLAPVWRHNNQRIFMYFSRTLQCFSFCVNFLFMMAHTLAGGNHFLVGWTHFWWAVMRESCELPPGVRDRPYEQLCTLSDSWGHRTSWIIAIHNIIAPWWPSKFGQEWNFEHGRARVIHHKSHCQKLGFFHRINLN